MTSRLLNVLRWGGVAAALAGVGLLAGCAAFRSHPPPPAPIAKVTPPPAPPPLPAPLDTHTFVLSPGQDVVGTVQITTARKQDTLLDIARRFNVGYNEIADANPGVDIWIPGAGTRVVVPTQFVLPNAPHVGIIVDVAALRLWYFPKHKPGEAQVVYTFPIGIGKAGWNTPEGVTHVTARVKDPVWRPSPALRKDWYKEQGEKLPAVVSAGPDNPLGAYEFKLGWPSYLIHGTNKPYGVGLRSSHGCVRLYPEDIVKLYEMAPTGTQVRVVNQPYLVGWQNHELYLQVYPPLEDDKRDWAHAQHRLISAMLNTRQRQALAAESETIDWQSVGALGTAARGVPAPITGDTAMAGLKAVLAAAPTVQNAIPAGADWDGSDDASADDKSPQQVLSDLEPGAATTAAAPAAQAATASKTGASGG